MTASITNWVSSETNVGAVQSAQTVLERVKKERYTKRKQYQLVKIGDHPLTFKEVLVEDKKIKPSIER
jgi:hypothetical protein